MRTDVMAEQMTAALYQGVEQVTIEKIDVPQIGPGEVLIKVHYAGICGTDMDIFKGKHPRAKAPLVMGHEFSGEIVEIDQEYKNHYPVGTRVVVEPLISCGKCYACLTGYTYVCQNLRLYGIDRNGAFAQYVKVDVKKVYTIPEIFSYEQAALIEPTAVAVHSVRISDVKLNDTVVVLGAGVIGTLIYQVVKLAGTKEIIVIDIKENRLDMAQRLGFTTINSTKTDPIEEVLRLTNGRGADIVFEVTGTGATPLQMNKMTRVRGEVVIVGMPKTPPQIDMLTIGFRELTLKGVRVYAPFDFERAIDIAAKRLINLDCLVSHRLNLSESPKGFDLLKNTDDAMKVLIKPN